MVPTMVISDNKGEPQNYPIMFFRDELREKLSNLLLPPEELPPPKSIAEAIKRIEELQTKTNPGFGYDEVNENNILC